MPDFGMSERRRQTTFPDESLTVVEVIKAAIKRPVA